MLFKRAWERGLSALDQLAGGFGTAFAALPLLAGVVITVITTPAGLGLLLAPVMVRLVRALADRERHRLGRFGCFGAEIVSPGPVPSGLRAALADATVRRELVWLLWHASAGLLLGAIGVLIPICALRDLTFPLTWFLTPEAPTTTSIGLGLARQWSDTFWVPLLVFGWLLLMVTVTPLLAAAQSAPGRRLLQPRMDLSLRIVELTATRAAALDAHAAELRRIERSLHDGSQNRLVAVTMLLGATRRALHRDGGAAVEDLLDRAQEAAELALAELRTVARNILPPVLTDRGLQGALTGLAASCGAPCRVTVDVPVRCAASVEATAYFVVAEALTNITKHSGANQATVDARQDDGFLHLRISDDGRGGADASNGTGLHGVRRRIEAHDGTLTVTSPRGGPTTLEVALPCGT